MHLLDMFEKYLMNFLLGSLEVGQEDSLGPP